MKQVPHRFKDDTQVPTVLKGSFEADDMFFVIGVGLFQFIENLDFLQPSAIPKKS
jgi:hypothetical protein